MWLNWNQIVKKVYSGITNWNEWTWPDEEEQGFIYARPLPGIGSWIKFSPKKNWRCYKKLFHSKT